MTLERFKKLVSESVLRLPPELKFNVRVGVDDRQPDLAIIIVGWMTCRKGFGFIHAVPMHDFAFLDEESGQGYVDRIMIKLWQSVYNESIMHAVEVEAEDDYQ